MLVRSLNLAQIIFGDILAWLGIFDVDLSSLALLLACLSYAVQCAFVELLLLLLFVAYKRF